MRPNLFLEKELTKDGFRQIPGLLLLIYRLCKRCNRTRHRDFYGCSDDENVLITGNRLVPIHPAE